MADDPRDLAPHPDIVPHHPIEKLVTTALDDSWSTLEAEVALIDRLFGGEIAALFER